MLTVITSAVRSDAPVVRGPYGSLTTGASVRDSAILPLVVGKGHWLSPDREVAPLRPPHVVVGQQEPGQARGALGGNPEKIKYFPLLKPSGREQLHAGVDFRKLTSRFVRGWRRRGDRPRGS